MCIYIFVYLYVHIFKVTYIYISLEQCVPICKVSARSEHWKRQIELWNRLHPRSATPKYFQGHVRLLGVTCRTTGWLLLKPLPVKLVPPNLAKDEVFFMFPNGKRI